MGLFKKNKSPFIYYSRDGLQRTIHYATVVEDEENKSKLEFFLPDFNIRLAMRQPTCYINGVPHREIAWNHNGQLNYVECSGIDDKEYLKFALTPEEKQLTLFRFKENRKRYDDNINKWQAYLTIGLIIAFIILILGFVLMSVQFKKQTENIVEAARLNNEAELKKGSDVGVMREISQIQLEVLTLLQTNQTLTRRIS